MMVFFSVVNYQIISHSSHGLPWMERSCAASLDLDADHVLRHGILLCGQTEVNALSELQPGKWHDITLVLRAVMLP